MCRIHRHLRHDLRATAFEVCFSRRGRRRRSVGHSERACRAAHSSTGRFLQRDGRRWAHRAVTLDDGELRTRPAPRSASRTGTRSERAVDMHRAEARHRPLQPERVPVMPACRAIPRAAGCPEPPSASMAGPCGVHSMSRSMLTLGVCIREPPRGWAKTNADAQLPPCAAAARQTITRLRAWPLGVFPRGDAAWSRQVPPERLDTP